MEEAILAHELTKSYGDLIAVDRIDFSVRKGEVFGLLGPNGAGKTTTIRMLSGLTRPDSGSPWVDGCDVVENPVEAKRSLGVVPESSNLYGELTALENLVYMAQLYGVHRAEWQTRSERLLKDFGLYDRKDSRFQSFSRGMKRRLTIAAALVHQPHIVFLDEPTTGLDVVSARELRRTLSRLNEQGTTLLLTTHLISEADELCDRIGLIVKGKIETIDTPEGLKQRVRETEVLEIGLRPMTESVCRDLDNLPWVEKSTIVKGGIRLYGKGVLKNLSRSIDLLERKRVEIVSIRSVGPTLEDAFVKLTGLDVELMQIDKSQHAT